MRSDLLHSFFLEVHRKCVAPFTSHGKLHKFGAEKPISWAKLTNFDFFIINFSVLESDALMHNKILKILYFPLLDLDLNFANSCAIRSPVQKTTKTVVYFIVGHIFTQSKIYSLYVSPLLLYLNALLHKHLGIFWENGHQLLLLLLLFLIIFRNFEIFRICLFNKEIFYFLFWETQEAKTRPNLRRGFCNPQSQTHWQRGSFSWQEFPPVAHTTIGVWTQDPLCAPRMDYTNKSSPGDERE